MSAHKVLADLNALTRTRGNGQWIGHGTTVPADASAGWINGAIFIQTDGADGAQVYINEGTATSSDFNAWSSDEYRDATARTITGAITNSANNTFSGTNTFSGQVDHSGTVIDPECISPTAALATMTAALHAGKTIVMTSLCRKATLPLATAALDGVSFTFVNAYAASAAATEMWIDPSSGDKINNGTTGVGLRLQATADAVGDHLKVICDGSDWFTIARFGTWAASSVG